MDEIKISKLWNSRSMAIVQTHIDTCTYLMLRIMDLFYLVGSADPRDMNLKFIERREVTYPQEVCI